MAHAREIDGGWVLTHPPLPDVWQLNRIHLTGEQRALSAAGLQALAAGELPDSPHARVTLDDAAAADALWPSLEAEGWRRERALVMVRRVPVADAGAAPVIPGAPEVAEVREAELVAFQALALADDAGGRPRDPGLPGRLARAQALLRAGTPNRALGAGTVESGLPAASVTLFLDGDVAGRRVAFLDALITLRAHRERGLARALTQAALGEAARWRADLVALLADAEDWPQLLHAALGFAVVGRQTVFHRDRHRPAAPGCGPGGAIRARR